jgi:NADPH2:quinone reductase
MGTCAQYIVLPQQQAVRLPQDVSFEAGACMGIPGLTAMHAVEKLGDVRGKTVLVIGAASGVGFYVAQMARARGARVIGTVGSPQKAQVLADHGIDEAIDYKKESVAGRAREMTAGRGVDAVVDMDFSTTVKLVPDGAVAPHGTVVCYGSNERGAIPLAFGAWLPRSISLHFFLVYDLLDAERDQAVKALTQLLQGGALRHLLAPAFALDEIAAAHEAVESGRVLGNVVVTLPD